MCRKNVHVLDRDNLTRMMQYVIQFSVGTT